MKRITQVILLGLLILGIVTVGQRKTNEHRDSAVASPSSMAFNHVIIDPAPPSSSGCCLDVLAVGDIDGDSYADVMVGSQGSIGAVWYHYPSWTRYVIGSGGFTTDGEIADLDGDGDGDVVISSDRVTRNVVEWWENAGDPFSQGGWMRHDIGGQRAHDLAVGDINGDGNPDVAAFMKYSTREIAWFEAPADPRGMWTPHIVDTVPNAEGLDVGDIDDDGDMDMAASRNWYENASGDGLTWTKHPITTDWGSECRDIIADMNGDGRKDIVLSRSEGSGRLSWFENPTWEEHVIEPDNLNGAHSLEVGDFDGDGDPDVMTGEMHFTATKRVLIYENLGGGLSWEPITLATTGTHNARIGDIGSDGDLDIVGKNFDGPKAVEMWENVTAQPVLSLDNWTYIQVDNSRVGKYFGLALGDLTGDGFGDLVAGPYFYRNPGGDMSGAWRRVDLPNEMDAVLIVDVDDDAYPDVIGVDEFGDGAVYWAEATDTQGSGWQAIQVGTLHQANLDTQGYTMAQIIPGGKPEIILSRGRSYIYYLEIPGNPSEGSWPITQVTDRSTSEGIGVGDIDGDGDLDIAAGTGVDPNEDNIAWWENPGDGTGNWSLYRIGKTDPRSYTDDKIKFPDRFGVADMNGDGRLDIVVSEEILPQDTTGASVYWFQQPADPKSPNWPRHLVVTQDTTNSMDVADMDRDGDIDIITGEHRGAEKVAVWENDGSGNFTEHVVDSGKESHLGARVADLDGDGDLDIVSIAWDDPRFLHLWRNDASVGQPPTATPTNTLTSTPTPTPTPPSTPTPTPTATPLVSQCVNDVNGNGIADVVDIMATAAELGCVVYLPVVADNWHQPWPNPTSTPANPPGTGTRAADGLQVLYTFEEASGTTIYDVSGVGTPLNLTLGNPAAATWIPGGLAINATTILASAGPATKVIDAASATNELAIEAWIRPANTTQDGPARIVTLSQDPGRRNFTLAQGLWGNQPSNVYDVRLRTTATSSNGTPSLTTPAGSLTTGLTHVVYTRDTSGVARVYVNGIEEASGTVDGDFSNWDGSLRLALANELTEDRPWRGEFHLVAIYSRALSAADVSQNFAAGPDSN